MGTFMEMEAENMRIGMIGCMVMNREISHLVSKSRHIVRVWWLRQGLHDTPDMLRQTLQNTIDEIELENDYLPETLHFEAIVLAYGLCANGVIGLHSRSLPIVVPRCDDCISLFLGSATRYRTLFTQLPGVYWYNVGWIEQAFTPSKENYARRWAEYAAVFGEENADYLMECTNNWMANYKHCGYITCSLSESPEYEAYARQAAADFGWKFTKVEGDMGFLEALVNGPWDDAHFLTCPPHCCIEAEYDTRKFRAVKTDIGQSAPNSAQFSPNHASGSHDIV
ncbi:DUF1638 domain-containing protein [Agathobaculum sp. LCP25S3_E8]|uniref:DUF1638 domain-containing protein n=1 Tax=Agathobaculum sp. LCP25S3_E8 TaxID=3438735 RepID=UPI003F903509